MLKYFKAKEYRAACWVNPRDFGKHGQSLVFIHGSGGNSSVWSGQYSKLHKVFNIAAVNLSGHGKSGGTGRTDIRAYTLDLKEIIHGLKLARPVLIGHSLGAAIALDFAAAYPEDAGGVVTVGGGLTMPVNPGILDGFAKEPQMILDMMCKLSLARENRPKFYDALRESLGQADVHVVAGDMLACSRFDLTAQIPSATVPVLAVCGREDKMTPPAMSEQIAAKIPGAKLFLIEGAGHMPMLERPLEFNQAVIDFARTALQAV